MVNGATACHEVSGERTIASTVACGQASTVVPSSADTCVRSTTAQQHSSFYSLTDASASSTCIAGLFACRLLICVLIDVKLVYIACWFVVFC